MLELYNKEDVSDCFNTFHTRQEFEDAALMDLGQIGKYLEKITIKWQDNRIDKLMNIPGARCGNPSGE